MSSLTLRTAKGSPLTNAEVDANFTNLLVAIGGANTSPYTLPTPTGTGSPVLSNSPTITGNVNIGAQANLTRFPNSVVSISNTAAGIQQNESHNIGLIAEGTANPSNTAIFGVGLYGVGYTSGATRSGGVIGEGHVSAASDTGSAIGVRGYSNDVHTGGMNIGLYGDAFGGSSNYALYMNSGGIYSNTAQTWVLNGNLTFSGAYSVTIPTLSLTNALSIASGGTGLTSVGTSGQILTSNGSSASWENAPISLPTQTGNNGKYLKTDGSTATWDALDISTNDISGIVPINKGGTGLSAVGTSGQVLTSTGSAIAYTSTLTNLKTQVIQEAITSITASTSTTTIDLSLGTVFVVTISANTTFAFTNVPAGTDMTSFTIITVNDATAGRAVSWPAAVTWAGGQLPTRTTAANKSDAWSFFTRNAGTTVVGSLSVANY